LNVAYATALWATCMMEVYPDQIHVVGIDIERVHPAWLQSRHENLELLFPVDYNDSVWGGLTPASFDYLHMDNLSASVADWSALLRTASRYPSRRQRANNPTLSKRRAKLIPAPSGARE